MLPKSKLNHNESSSLNSLNSLNSVNNMMINLNNSNLINNHALNKQALAQQQSNQNDERYSCRALICDSNGIIIGETAYRCMICSQINDSIAETKQHYYENHSNEFLSNSNLSNSLSNSNIASTNGNFITNSILNNSLNNSLNNGGLQFPASQFNSFQSNSILNNDKLNKKKNLVDIVEKLVNSKNQRQQATSLIQQSTGNLANFIGSNKERDLIAFNRNLTQQLNLNSQFNQQDEFDEDELDDQKSDLDADDWYARPNQFNSLNNLSTTDLISNNAILEAFNKTSLFQLKDNLNDQQDLNNSKSKTINKLNQNNLFDSSLETDYSNANIYENSLMNLTDDQSNNKDDILRNIPPAVKLKRGSTTANVGKPGHVSCAVCGVVRYYSCVYRRYGQFTCQVCYRFFRTFFSKPHRYTCTNLGSCPLDVRVRCRACWIQACIDLYTVDGQRKQILDSYRPLNKSADDESLDKNNNSPSMGDKNCISKLTRGHEDDDLDSSRNSKKLKKSFNEQYISNGDIEEDEFDLSKQDDQEEPLNFTKKNDLSDDEDLKDEED